MNKCRDNCNIVCKMLLQNIKQLLKKVFCQFIRLFKPIRKFKPIITGNI